MTNNSNTTNNSSAILNALYSTATAIWQDIFDSSVINLGVSGLTATLLFYNGFNLIIEKAIFTGFVINKGFSLYDILYNSPENKEEKVISNTKKVFTLVSLDLLLNINTYSIVFYNSLMTFNFLANPLVQGTMIIIGLGFALDIIELLTKSIANGTDYNKIFNLFTQPDNQNEAISIDSLIYSIAIGTITTWLLFPGLMNPFNQIFFLDGVMQTTFLSILSYFHGAIIYETSSNLLSYFKENLNIFQIYNEKSELDFKIKPNEDTVIGDFCGGVQSIMCSMYSITRELSPSPSYLSSFFKTKDKEESNGASSGPAPTHG